MKIDEAVEIAFKAIGLKEVHISELSDHIKTSISDFKDEDIEGIKSRVSGYLARNVKSKSAIYVKAVNSKTKRAKKGVYSLAKPKKIRPIIKTDSQPSLFPDIKAERSQRKNPISESKEANITPSSPTERLYFGKAGEYAVASELLFRGYNASVMSVDEGIDVSASKNDKFFFIQVKSTSFKDGVIKTSLKPNRFIENTGASVYFIIVFRYKYENANVNRYVIFPYNDMNRFKVTGLVSQTDSGIQIKIKQENGSLVLFNGSKQETIEAYYLDNFELLK